MNTEAMAQQATVRLTQHINRSAGQHSRAIREARQIDAPTTADIFAIGMESVTAYRFAEWLCKGAGVSYPPQQTEAL
jgi:hypothetical protein